MLTTKGSALVAGEPLGDDQMRTVRALRGFLDHTKTARWAGEIVSVPSRFAAELVTNRKAEWYTPPVEPVAVPAPVAEVLLTGTATMLKPVQPPPDTESGTKSKRSSKSSEGSSHAQ